MASPKGQFKYSSGVDLLSNTHPRLISKAILSETFLLSMPKKPLELLRLVRPVIWGIGTGKQKIAKIAPMLKCRMRDQNSRLVYSTSGAVSKKEEPAGRDIPTSANPAKRGMVVRLDRKGRGGKSVTVIEGLKISAKESEKLLKLLKAKLGTGGTIRKGTVEIQGDHCDMVMTELTKMGYRPKRSGE
jgi:translation initiation factor 1